MAGRIDAIDVHPDLETMQAALRLVAALGGGSDLLASELMPVLLQAMKIGEPHTDAEALEGVATLLWALTVIAECALHQAEARGADRLSLMAWIESGIELYVTEHAPGG